MERAVPRFPIWPCSRWGLPCPRDCSWGGGLLPHLFTLTRPMPSWTERFEFLWHCPSGCLAASLPACIPNPTTRVTRHRALWSSDFPLPARAGSDPPPFRNQAARYPRVRAATSPRLEFGSGRPVSPQKPNPCAGRNRGFARNSDTKRVPAGPGR